MVRILREADGGGGGQEASRQRSDDLRLAAALRNAAVSRMVGAVRAAPPEEVIVLRTPGGLLEVSRIEATEVFDATIKHTLLGFEVGETVPRIRVPAVYRYHIELEPDWRVVRPSWRRG